MYLQEKVIGVKSKNTKWESFHVGSSQMAADVAVNFYGNTMEIFESFYIMMINRSGSVIAFARIGVGGVAGVLVDAKIVAKYAVENLASAVILIHNHPSGNLDPSQADKKITKKLKTGLALLDIVVHDHLIVTSEGHFSFSDHGLL